MAKIFKKTNNYFIVEDSVSGAKEIEIPSKDVVLVADRTNESVRLVYQDAEGKTQNTDYAYSGVQASGTVTLTGGASGSVDTLTVGGVSIISGAVAFDTDLDTTAANLAANITAHTSDPNFTAEAVGAVVTFTAVLTGNAGNGAIVVSTTTITTTEDAATTGGAGNLIDAASAEYDNFEDAITGSTGIGSITGA